MILPVGMSSDNFQMPTRTLEANSIIDTATPCPRNARSSPSEFDTHRIS